MEYEKQVSKVDYFYYNISLANTSESLGFIPCQYSQTQQDNIIEGDCSEWLVNMNRFRLPTTSIPLFFFKDNTYFVTIRENGGAEAPQPVIYIPQTATTTAPYDKAVFSEIGFIGMINNALETAYNLVPGHTANPPFIYLDPATELATLVLDAAMPGGWFSSTNSTGVSILFNFSLFEFFPTFSAFFLKSPQGGSGAPNLDYVLNLYDNHGINTFPNPNPTFPGLTYTTLFITQEKPTIYKFNQITGIIFASGRLPINREYVGSAVNTNVGDSLNTGIQMFLDFEVDATAGSFTRGYFQYNAQNNPRYVSLLKKDGLRDMDIFVYWMGNLARGEVFPVYLAPNDVFTCKLQFTRRAQRMYLTNPPESKVKGGGDLEQDGEPIMSRQSSNTNNMPVWRASKVGFQGVQPRYNMNNTMGRYHIDRDVTNTDY